MEARRSRARAWWTAFGCLVLGLTLVTLAPPGLSAWAQGTGGGAQSQGKLNAGRARVAQGGGVPSGAVPVNDDCCGNLPLVCFSSAFADNTNATTVPEDPPFSCHPSGPSTQGVGTLWYRFVATETRATVDTVGSPPPADNSLIAVYRLTSGLCTGLLPCPGLVELGCSNDDGTGALSSVTVDGLIVGDTYMIQLASLSPENLGVHTLNLSCTPSPNGGLCFEIDRYRSDEERLRVRASFSAGEGFDPRQKDLRINVIDQDGDMFPFDIPGSAFEHDGDDEFEAEIEANGLEIEVEFDLDDCELEIEIEGEDHDDEPFEELEGPMVTVELVFSQSGTASDTITAEQDGDELEFRRDGGGADCCNGDSSAIGGAGPWLDIDPEENVLGEIFEIEVRDEPGRWVRVFLTAVDGIPVSAKVAQGRTDGRGNFLQPMRTVPDPALNQVELTFQALVFGPGGVRASDVERLVMEASVPSDP